MTKTKYLLRLLWWQMTQLWNKWIIKCYVFRILRHTLFILCSSPTQMTAASIWNCQKWTVLLRALQEMRQTIVKTPRWVSSSTSTFIESAEMEKSYTVSSWVQGVPWKSWVLFPCLNLFHGIDRSQQNVNKAVNQLAFETKVRTLF